MDDLTRRQQFYQFSKGRPRAHVFQTVSSIDAPERERYDYWLKSVIYNLEVPRPNAAQQRDFVASVTSLATLSGEMHHVEADGYEGIRTRGQIRADGGEELALLYVLDGRIEGSHEHGADAVAGPGEFYLFDAARPGKVQFCGRHSMIQIDLSRPLLASIFTGSIPDPALIGKALNSSRLSGLLGAHLAQFPKKASALNPMEQLGLLDASEAFAITTIETAFTSAYGDRGSRNEGLFAAAQRYIRLNLGKKTLGAEEIARAIGCSRASLYRLFANYHLTVNGQIRELRLQKLKAFLEGPDQLVPISVLAERCGLFDTPNVNRAFRHRFGLSPSELRESQSSSADGDTGQKSRE